MPNMSRRKFLCTSAIGSAVAITGCLSLDNNTPEMIWESKLPVGIAAPIGVADDYLYVTQPDRDVGLFQLTRESGEITGYANLGQAPRSAPVADAGTIYVGSAEPAFFALEARDPGIDKDWEVTVHPQTRFAPALTDRTITFSTTSSRAVCLSRDSGDVLWNTATGGNGDRPSYGTTVQVADGVAVVGNQDGTVTTLDHASGEQLWTAETDTTAHGTINDNRVIITGNTVEIRALASGEVSETIELGTSSSRIRPAVVADGTIVLAVETADGQTRIVGIDGSEIVWELLRESRRPVGIRADRSDVFVATSGGELLAIDAESGDVEWELEVENDLMAPPTVTENEIILGDRQGVLRVFERN